MVATLSAIPLAAWRAFFWTPAPDFPRVDDIRQMQFVLLTKRDFENFAIPDDYWKPLFRELSRARWDRSPAKWVEIGVLEISLHDGSHYQVNVYSTGTRHAAFSAGENWETRKYYYGGSEAMLSALLTEALAAQGKPVNTLPFLPLRHN